MNTGVSQVFIEGVPLAHLKVNCPKGAREGGLGHWLLSVRAESNIRLLNNGTRPAGRNTFSRTTYFQHN